MDLHPEGSETILPARTLGPSGAPEPGICAGVAITAMNAVAGAGMRLVSLSLDVGSHRLAEDDVRICANADKSSKSVVFASAEAHVDGVLAFRAQALFARVQKE